MILSEFLEKVKSGEIDVLEHIHKVLEYSEKHDEYFNVISKDLALDQVEELKKNKSNHSNEFEFSLFGVPISVKDNICVKGIESRAGSKILSGYKTLFNAVSVEKSINSGAIIIGKASQDEFGFGSFNTNVGIDFKIPRNPIDDERCTGGSSGGSAGFTKIMEKGRSEKNMIHLAIAESTGGSIASPSSYCGVFGLTPTYGLVSRYGLIDYASSLDKIGTMSNHSEDAFVLLDIIKGKDENDNTSVEIFKNKNKKEKQSNPENLNKVKKIAIVSDFMNLADEEVSKECWNAIKRLENNGIDYEKVILPINLKYSIQSYYIIAMSEASTNLAKFCGMRYGQESKLEGNFNQYFSKIRSENLGNEAKRRIILGTFARMAGFRDAYYIKAMKARTLIIQEYKKIFKDFDLVVHPTMPNIAPKFSEIKKFTPLQEYSMDVMTAGCNLAGLPHLSIPINKGNSKNKEMPIGLLATADHFSEEKLRFVGNMFDED